MKKVVAAVVVWAFCAHSAQAVCANKTEQTSMNIRALQSELMVAALSCGMNKQYNDFINTFASPLTQHGKVLKAYFQRNYSGGSERELNRFITQLANQASRVSLNQVDTEYCKNATKLFTFINKADTKKVDNYVMDRYQPWHGVPSCTVHEVAER